MEVDSNYVIRTAAYEAVMHGDAEIVGERDGEPIFKLTDTGRERAEKIIDSAIRAHGHLAAEAIAEALGVDLEVGEALVSMRQKALLDELANEAQDMGIY